MSFDDCNLKKQTGAQQCDGFIQIGGEDPINIMYSDELRSFWFQLSSLIVFLLDLISNTSTHDFPQRWKSVRGCEK